MKVYLIAFLDLILGMLMMVILQMNPKADNEELIPPGNFSIYSVWPDTGDDVDLWLLGPEMSHPIGFSNKASKYCNLVVDDQGRTPDAIPVNFENIFCREIPDGDYSLNIQAYRVAVFPTSVHIKIVTTMNGVAQTLYDDSVSFNTKGEEVTVVRFTMKDGQLVPGSIHHTPIKFFR